MTATLGLGTVQFGLDYGISNRGGRPDEREAHAIVRHAIEAGIDVFDTAPAYGDAEVLLGRSLDGARARIVTKTAGVAEPCIEARHGVELVETVERSLARLRVRRVHGVMLHRPDDLAKPGAEHLVEALGELKTRGVTARIGVSIYDERQWDLAAAHGVCEIVQLPLNALDQRPVRSGLLRRMKQAGAEVHTRSTFLQGLLLMPPAELLEFFAPIRAEIETLHANWAKRGLSPLAGCLSAVLGRDDVDVAIVGVNSLSEFQGLLRARADAERTGGALDDAPDVAPQFLDPSQWPKAAA